MKLAAMRCFVARTLIVTLCSTFNPRAEGAVIGTDTAINADRERILILLDRPEVTVQLEAYGVRMSDARARIAALTDAEAAQLSAEIDKAYAAAGGGDAFVALLMVPLTIIAVIVLIPFFLLGAVVYGVVTGKGSADPIGTADRYQP